MSPYSTTASTTTQPLDSFYPSHHEFIHELTYPPTPPSSQQQQQQQQAQQKQQQVQLDAKEEDEAWLPKGWKTVGNSRRRSLLEVVTNIRTLGELYRALSDIRNQLPSPVATAMEEAHAAANRPVMLARGSSNNTATPTTPGGGYDPWNHINSETTPASLLHSPGTFNQFAQQLSQYPASVFDALVRLHLNCTSYRRIDKDRFLEQYRQGHVHAGLVCAIYAYSAVHGMVCHPDQFGIYPFMDQLAKDCYQLAHDLVEFDRPSKTTIETLVLMQLYLAATTSDTNQQYYLSLAERHMCMAEKNATRKEDFARLKAWMLQTDLLLAMRTMSPPVLYDKQQQQPLVRLRPASEDERLPLLAIEIELEGLARISQHDHDLGSWRDKIRKNFPYTNHPHPNDNASHLVNRYALRLHALFFAGKLQIHQSNMMQSLSQHNDRGWSDYFTELPSNNNDVATTNQVEAALMESMRAGFGLVQIVWTLFQANDRCMIIELMDTLSAAFSVLYYGNKMVERVHVACQEAMIGLIHAFISSPSMMQSSGIRQFVQKWQCVLPSNTQVCV